jgi:hypothetical protein
MSLLDKLNTLSNVKEAEVPEPKNTYSLVLADGPKSISPLAASINLTNLIVPQWNKK